MVDATRSAISRGGATENNVVLMLNAALRRLGMIATSPSIWRHWIVIRWKKYPFVRR